jgi:hypothetical protein
MKRSVFVGSGILWSSLFAGPIFILATAAAFFYHSLPNAVAVDENWFTAESAMSLFISIVPVSIFGFILALLPNILGAVVMGQLGRYFETARSPLAWGIMGVAMVAIPLNLFQAFEGDGAPAAVGLLLTAGLCALVSRRNARWPIHLDAPVSPVPASVSPPARSALAPRNTGARLLD